SGTSADKCPPCDGTREDVPHSTMRRYMTAGRVADAVVAALRALRPGPRQGPFGPSRIGSVRALHRARGRKGRERGDEHGIRAPAITRFLLVVLDVLAIRLDPG